MLTSGIFFLGFCAIVLATAAYVLWPALTNSVLPGFIWRVSRSEKPLMFYHSVVVAALTFCAAAHLMVVWFNAYLAGSVQ